MLTFKPMAVHYATVANQRTWGQISQLTIVVSHCRHYFGDQVGFYLAYLNALTCWLLAPAAASSFLIWALGGTGMDRTGTQACTANDFAAVCNPPQDARLCRPCSLSCSSSRSRQHRTEPGTHSTVLQFCHVTSLGAALQVIS